MRLAFNLDLNLKFKKFRKNNPTIEFALKKEYEGLYAPPIPAIEMLPTWYTQLPSFRVNGEAQSKSHVFLNNREGVEDKFERTTTIKQCMPVFDVLTAGYLITCPVDLAIKYARNELTGPIVNFTWEGETSTPVISTHDAQQLDRKFFGPNTIIGNTAYKLTNNWKITTPKGYSVLYTSPYFHAPSLRIMPGIVDTDQWHNTNFPFEWIGGDGEFVIKKGTPLVQVIPFKREDWSYSTTYLNSAQYHKFDVKMNQVTTLLSNGYKKLFWSKKNYKVPAEEKEQAKCPFNH